MSVKLTSPSGLSKILENYQRYQSSTGTYEVKSAWKYNSGPTFTIPEDGLYFIKGTFRNISYGTHIPNTEYAEFKLLRNGDDIAQQAMVTSSDHKKYERFYFEVSTLDAFNKGDKIAPYIHCGQVGYKADTIIWAVRLCDGNGSSIKITT